MNSNNIKLLIESNVIVPTKKKKRKNLVSSEEKTVADVKKRRGEEEIQEIEHVEKAESTKEVGEEHNLKQHFAAHTTKELDATFMASPHLNIATVDRGKSQKLQAVSMFFQDLVDTYADMPSFAKEAMKPSLVRENVERLYDTFFEENAKIMGKDEFFTPVRSIAYKWLLEDIERMVKVFLRVTQKIQKSTKGKKIKFTLKGVNENGCELFHQDYVPVRMLVCYLGPSTEWVPNSAVDWAFLNNPKSVITNEKLIKNYPEPIRQIPTNDVLIMKGAINILKKVQHKACIHRSPEIKSSGQVRVVLQFDL